MRRIVLLIMAALVLVTLFGCKPVKKEAATPPTGTTGIPAPGTTAETGPVKFGFIFELTGNAATFGVSGKQGAELAVDEINTAGGVLGRQIEPVWDDNASLPDQAVKVASKQINQDKVAIVIGSETSSNTIAVAKIAEDAQVPMVSPAATNPKVTLNEDGTVRQYVFRACFTDDFQGERIAQFAVMDPIKAKNAVIFYDADNDYSVGIYDKVKEVAPGLGLKIVGEDSFLSSSETDFRTKLNKFKGLKFDVLIVPGYYNQVALIANQARELGLKQPLLGGDGFDSPDLWKVAGKNIEGSYFTNHYASDDKDPAVQNFIAQYKARYGGNVPDAMAILSYDATKLAADAITRAGSTDPTAIAKALAETRDFQAASGKITIDPQHNAIKKLVVLRIEPGGQFKLIHTFEPAGAAPPAGETPAAGEAPAGGEAGAETPPAGKPGEEAEPKGPTG